MISECEYQAMSLWNARLMVGFRLMMDSEGDRPQQQVSSYWSSKKKREISKVSYKSEAIMTLSHIAHRGGQHGEVWLNFKKIVELKEILQEVHDVLYSVSNPAFGRYSDGTLTLTDEAASRKWVIDGLMPRDRVIQIVLGIAPDNQGTPCKMEGVVMQIENVNSASILNWRDFNALKTLIDNVRMELVTPSMIQMIYFENFMQALKKQ